MDNIKPNYYKGKSGRDVNDFINDFDLNFFIGNIIKYIVRYKGKNGLEDLKKAREYLDRLIAFESGEEKPVSTPTKTKDNAPPKNVLNFENNRIIYTPMQASVRGFPTKPINGDLFNSVGFSTIINNVWIEQDGEAICIWHRITGSIWRYFRIV